MDTKIVRQRIFWLDGLRASAACAVIIMHTLTGAVDIMDTGRYQDGKWMLVIMDMVTWCVPVFLMISGYLFLDPKRNFSFIDMLKKYCFRILLALLVFGIPFSCLELIITERTFRPAMLGEAFIMVLIMKSWSHLWYLYLILLLYLLTPAIKRILEKISPGLLMLVMIILLVGSSILPFINKMLNQSLFPSLPENMIYLFYYLMGYIIYRKGRNNLDPKGRREPVILAGLVIILIAVILYSRLWAGLSLQMAYNYPVTVVLSVILTLLAERLHMRDSAVKLWIAGLAEISFTIYLIHPVFIHLMYKGLKISITEYPLLAVLTPLAITIFILSAVCALILHRSNILKKYVL